MKRLAMVVGLAAVLAFFPTTAAQTPDSVEFVSATVVKVKPERVSAFEDYAKQVLAAAGKAGMTSRWDGYQTIHGGSPFVYSFVVGHRSMADLDNAPRVPELLAKAFGEKEGMRIMNQGREAIEEVDLRVLRYHGDLSANARPPGDSKYIYGIEMKVRPEMTTRFLDMLRTSKGATEKTPGTPTVLYHSVMVGEGSQFLAILPFNSWEERAKWPSYETAMKTALGEDGWKQLSDTRANAVVESRTWVVMHRPDLSFKPKTTTD